MIIKTITYMSYNGRQLTEDFYFSFSQVEAQELDLEHDGIQSYVKKIAATEDIKKAWYLFKELVLKSYGKKSSDGRFFHKRDPETGVAYRDEFEASPALSELLVELCSSPEAGAKFVEGTLPQDKLDMARVEEQRAAAAPPAQDAPVAPTLQSVPTPEPEPERKAYFSEDELMKMSDAEFDAAVGTDPRKMTQDHLRIAFIRKTSK